MKTYLIQILLLITLFASSSIAQDKGFVDVRAKVKAQMLKAQANMPMVQKNDLKKESGFSFPNISMGIFRILILALSSIILISFVFLRRVKIKEKAVTKQFRENIRLLREENLRKPIDYSLTPVRKSLLEKIESCFEEKTISALARKLKIAKGEIHLVNSIKSYSSAINMARN